MDIDTANLTSGFIGAILGSILGGVLSYLGVKVQIKNDRELLEDQRKAQHRDSALQLLGTLKANFHHVRQLSNSWMDLQANKSNQVEQFRVQLESMRNIFTLLDQESSSAWNQLIVLIEEYSTVDLSNDLISGRIHDDVVHYIDFVGKYLRSLNLRKPISFQKRPYLKRDSLESWEFPELDNLI